MNKLTKILQERAEEISLELTNFTLANNNVAEYVKLIRELDRIIKKLKEEDGKQ